MQNFGSDSLVSLPTSSQAKQKVSVGDTGLWTGRLIYSSSLMKILMDMVERVAPSLTTILIQGESGTGKELVARILHQKSRRSHKPFVAVNCATLQDPLLESELFGHEKGSFTGAVTQKIGLVEAAQGGTLFLDEVGELSLAVQTKLLRFLQEGEFYRVGGKEVLKSDVRVILATNRDLLTEVRRGNFREDLYYRISTIILEVPPLRRRREDIPLLLNYFMKKGEANLGRSAKKFTDAALNTLVQYDWPGNIRELENFCERILVLSDKEEIDVVDLPESMTGPKALDVTRDYDPRVRLADLEKVWLIKALEHFRGNKTQAATALGITIKTLYNKLHEYGVFEKYSLHSPKSRTGN